MFSNIPPPPEKSCRLRDDVVKYVRNRQQASDDKIILRMRFAFCITKATDIHSEYVIFIILPLKQQLHESFSKLRNIDTAYLVPLLFYRFSYILKPLIFLCQL